MCSAHGHSDKCQALFSALYTEGAARRIGENMEQLWSELYPLRKIFPFSGTGRGLDVLQLALSRIAHNKGVGVFSSLLAKFRPATAIKSSMDEKVASLASLAAGLGERAGAQPFLSLCAFGSALSAFCLPLKR